MSQTKLLPCRKMEPSFDPGALLARSYVLPRGPRVCLRLARVRDLPALAQLLERQGIEPDELELARLVRFDPRRRIVICATALIGCTDAIVGFGVIERGNASVAQPEALVVDDHLTNGLDELLARALTGRARALAGAGVGAVVAARAA